MIPRRNVKKTNTVRQFFLGGGGEIRCIMEDVQVEHSGFTE